MRHKARHREFYFTSDTFNLAVQEAEDPERVAWAREQEDLQRAEARRIESERQQEMFNQQTKG